MGGVQAGAGRWGYGRGYGWGYGWGYGRVTGGDAGRVSGSREGASVDEKWDPRPVRRVWPQMTRPRATGVVTACDSRCDARVQQQVYLQLPRDGVCGLRQAWSEEALER